MRTPHGDTAPFPWQDSRWFRKRFRKKMCSHEADFKNVPAYTETLANDCELQYVVPMPGLVWRCGVPP